MTQMSEILNILAITPEEQKSNLLLLFVWVDIFNFCWLYNLYGLSQVDKEN